MALTHCRLGCNSLPQVGRWGEVPRKSPFEITLSKAVRRDLEQRARKYTLPYFLVLRARMILLAAEGLSNDEIAHRLSARREVVSLWRKRFFEQGLAGLEERP